MNNKGIISVLIVDDSRIFCNIAARGIEADHQIEIVGFATDPFEARDKILELDPDVLLVDIGLPKMDGLTFLRKLMPQYPVPTVVVSGQENRAEEALEAGAVDFVKKPSGGGAEGLNNFFQELIDKIKIASMANVSGYKNNNIHRISSLGNKVKTEKIIAIGASTGGTEALYQILKELPRNMPGIVVVQHMPENFTKMYAERLNNTCQIEAKEGVDGDLVLPGKVIIAPGGCHMKLVKGDNGYRVSCFQSEKLNGHRPSVDVLFHSVAKEAEAKAIGVILTGMGHDGAKGLMEMKAKGAYTIGQDEKTCIVYGMPKVAYDLGGVSEQLALQDIAQKLYYLTRT